MLKLNDEELPLLAKLLNLEGDDQGGDDRELVGQLARVANLELVALTRGPNGALIYKDGTFSDFGGVETNVVDTVGAGDAFTAAMVVGLLAGNDIDSVNRNACEVAAYVCSQAGATPKMPERLRIATNGSKI